MSCGGSLGTFLASVPHCSCVGCMVVFFLFFFFLLQECSRSCLWIVLLDLAPNGEARQEARSLDMLDEEGLHSNTLSDSFRLSRAVHLFVLVDLLAVLALAEHLP